MVMGECRTFTVGQKSRLGEESRDEGLDERERGDMGLGRGEAACCSTKKRRLELNLCFVFVFLFSLFIFC